jgi:ArsR family transcriptional regulator
MPLQDALRRFKADFFQALAHPTRIAIIERLREGEWSVGQIVEHLGIEQANISQHLAVLRSKNIVVARREANEVFYSLRDPLIGEVLDIMRRYFHAHLSESLGMLEEMAQDTAREKKTRE